MFAGPRRLLKGIFFDGAGTLSLSRVALVFVVVEVNTIVVLGCVWIWHVTVSNQMAEAAPLAQAVFTGVAAVLSAQVVMSAAQYAVAHKWGSGSISGRQLDVDDARTAILAGEEPAHIPEIGPELVPDSDTEPRVMAESQPSEPVVANTYQDPATGEVVTTGIALGDLEEPVDVNIVGDETEEKR